MTNSGQINAGSSLSITGKDIRDKYLQLSNNNIAEVQSCIFRGDVSCVTRLESGAATAAEVSGAFPVGYGDWERTFTGRQNNVNNVGSVNPDSLFGTDRQQAEEIARFRTENCGSLAPAACDTLTQQALDYRLYRVALLGATGTASAVAVRTATRLVPPRAKASPALPADSGAGADNNFTRDDGVDPYAAAPNAQSEIDLSIKRRLDEATGTFNPHYDSKHGPYTTNQQQYERAMFGIDPATGRRGTPADASKFFNAADMMNSIKQAEAMYAANPTAYREGQIDIDFNRPVGSGYLGATKKNLDSGLTPGEYRWTRTVTVRIDLQTHRVYTAYPNIGVGSKMQDPR